MVHGDVGIGRLRGTPSEGRRGAFGTKLVCTILRMARIPSISSFGASLRDKLDPTKINNDKNSFPAEKNPMLIFILQN